MLVLLLFHFERTKEEKGVIHYHQIKGLREFVSYRNMIAGFLFNFRKKDNMETTYFQHINDFDRNDCFYR
mgnify:CR=1 FL=1